MKKTLLFICCLLTAVNVLAQKTVDGVKFAACVNKDIPKDFYRNKYLVLDFWATWCGPCIGSFPKVRQFEAKYKNNRQIVFATLTAESKGKIDTFYRLHKDKMPDAFHLVDDNAATWDYFDMQLIPTILVFAPSGKLVFRGDIDDLSKKMGQLLSGKNLLPTDKPKPTVDKWQLYKDRADFIALTAPANKDGGGTSNWRKGDTVEVSCSNETIKEMMAYLGGLTDMRISVSNAEKGAKPIDLYYKQTKSNFPEFDKGLFAEQYKNHIVHLLEKNYGFHSEWITERSSAYKIVITNAVAAGRAESISTRGSGGTMTGKNKFKLINYTLSSIGSTAEDALNITFVEDTEKKGYDIDVDCSSMQALEKSLASYGLGLQKVDGYEVKKLKLTFD